MDGRDYHWCTKDNWSGGEVHNGMYAQHKECGHDAWRKEIDDTRATKRGLAPTHTPTNTP